MSLLYYLTYLLFIFLYLSVTVFYSFMSMKHRYFINVIELIFQAYSAGLTPRRWCCYYQYWDEKNKQTLLSSAMRRNYMTMSTSWKKKFERHSHLILLLVYSSDSECERSFDIDTMFQNVTYFTSLLATEKYPVPPKIERYKDGCYRKKKKKFGVGRSVSLSVCLSQVHMVTICFALCE